MKNNRSSINIDGPNTSILARDRIDHATLQLQHSSQNYFDLNELYVDDKIFQQESKVKTIKNITHSSSNTGSKGSQHCNRVGRSSSSSTVQATALQIIVDVNIKK
jgi:hypothetical protein